MVRRVATLGLVLLLAGCAEASYPPEQLSGWGLFTDAARQLPAEGVIPYEINSPLFSDYTAKHRFLRLPPGGQITYTSEGDWVFPEGTVLVKTFAYPLDMRDASAGERILETRLLVLEEDGWRPYIYVWNEQQTDAVLTQTGARIDVSWIHDDGETRSLLYRVPNAIQCANCHGGRDAISPIGPRSEQLDMAFDHGAGLVNQIDHLASLGAFTGAVPPASERRPLPDPFGDADLDARGRAYLDANCAHCHRENGAAHQSGLWLGASITDATRLGICKVPAAAGDTGGRRWDIVPGAPEQSLMIYRMESDVPGTKMPELTLLVHREGLELIREWIAAMPPTACE